MPISDAITPVVAFASRKPRDGAEQPYKKQQSSTTHSDWKIVNQMRALKEHLGLGSILGTLAIVIAIGAPAVKQGEINGSTATALDKLTAAQRENKDEQTKALNEAVFRIEAGIKTAVDLSQQSLIESRSLRSSTETALGQLRQDTMGLWKWSTDIGNRVGQLEAESKSRKEK